MNKIITTGIALSTIFTGTVEAQAANFTLDSFDREFQKVLVDITSPESPTIVEDTSNFDTNILGGFRTILAQAVNPTRVGEVVSEVARASFISTDGEFSISSSAGIEGFTRVTYDGNSVSGDSGSLSLNLLETNTDAFGLEVLSIDLTGELTFVVVGNNGETASLSKSNITEEEVFFDYDKFALSGSTFEDIFTDVASISFEVSGPEEFDATFDNIRAVETSVSVFEYSSVLSLIGIFALAAVGLKNKMGKES